MASRGPVGVGLSWVFNMLEQYASTYTEGWHGHVKSLPTPPHRAPEPCVGTDDPLALKSPYIPRS